MMKCPKCGFVQPPDEYCANCGVKVKLYEAKGLHWLHKIWQKGGVFVLLILTGAAITGGYFLYLELLQNKSNLPEYFADESQYYQEGDELEHASQPEGLADPEEPGSSNITQKENVDTKQQAQEPVLPEKIDEKTRFEFVFAELPFSTIDQLAAQHIPGALGVYRTNKKDVKAMINDLKKNNQIILLSGEFQLSQDSDLEYGKEFSAVIDDENSITFNFAIRLDEVNNGSALFVIKGGTRFPASINQDIVYEETVPINSTESRIITGFVPRVELPLEWAESIDNGPLQVLSSPDFLQESSELVLIVGPAKKQ